MGRIASLGVAPFIMQSTESLVNITLNTGLQSFGGDLYVGSMTIMQSIMQMLVMPVNGISQGAQPIMSYNYGAKNYARVRETFRLLLKITMGVTVVCCLLLVLFPGVPARLFTQEQALIDLVVKTMPIFFAGIWAFARADGLPDLHGPGPGQDQPVPGAAAEDHSADPPGHHPAPDHRQRAGHLCGRAHCGHCGQLHHADAVFWRGAKSCCPQRTRNTPYRRRQRK